MYTYNPHPVIVHGVGMQARLIIDDTLIVNLLTIVHIILYMKQEMRKPRSYVPH